MVINGSKKYNRQGLVLPHCLSPLQKSRCQTLPVMEEQSRSHTKPPAVGLRGQRWFGAGLCGETL